MWTSVDRMLRRAEYTGNVFKKRALPSFKFVRVDFVSCCVTFARAALQHFNPRCQRGSRYKDGKRQHLSIADAEQLWRLSPVVLMSPDLN